MYYEQDYIMRMIKEIVRALLRIFFRIDTDSPTAELLENEEQRNTMNALFDMVDAGHIDEAENLVYGMRDVEDPGCLEMGILFYNYLNEKDDDFLLAHQYSREEVQFGLRDLVAQFGVLGMDDLFFMVSLDLETGQRE